MKLTSIKFIATAIIIIVCIITLSIFGYLSYKNTKESIEKKYFKESELVLKNKMYYFENLFESTEHLLTQLSRTEEVTHTERFNESYEAIPILELVQPTIPNSKEVEYGLKNGHSYTNLGQEKDMAYDPREQGWYQAAKNKKGKVIWTDPYLDYFTQEIIITAAKAVITSDGEFMGVVAVDFHVTTVSEDISKSSIGQQGFVMLLSQKGTIIANKNDMLIGKVFSGELQSTPERNGEYIIDGESYYYKFDRLEQNQMVIVALTSKGEIQAEVLKANLPIQLTGVFSLLIFSFFAYIAALRGIYPIARLGSLMKLAEEGNYEVYSDIRAYDEINRLSNSFNRMLDAIRKRDRDLVASNSELKETEEKLRQQYEKLEKSQVVLKENEKKIMDLASYDSLTGLLNRRKLIETLNNFILSDKIQKLAVVFIDLDNFKIINDTMGHSVGDELIIEIANRFKSILKFDKVVARLGGDEFIMIVNNIESKIEINEVSLTILKELERPVIINNNHYNVSGSVGIASYPLHGKSSEELLKNADMAMYKAKENGKNCFRIFDEGIQREIEEKAEIEKGIRDSLQHDLFSLYYQPIYDLHEKRISSVEALLRSHTSALAKTPIPKIIEAAEETGLIVEIDKWVFRNACMFAQSLNSELEKKVKVSINISAIHIMQQTFVDSIKSMIKDLAIDPRLLILEITETAVMESYEINIRKLEELKELGFTISLDDFGTGYSSLNYLNKLPIDYVKIDKSFVDAMLSSKKESNVISSMIELSHNLGLKVVAEGVETEKQFNMLGDFLCDTIQGYYFSKPITSEETISKIGSI